MQLIEPDRHEGLSAGRWDEGAARRAIETIARDCEDCFSPDRLWPSHPLDTEGEVAAPFTMLYMGAAGVIWALDCLARRGFAHGTDRFAPTLAALEALNLRQIEPWGQGVESYLMGRSGVLLTSYRVRPSREVADRLAQSVAATPSIRRGSCSGVHRERCMPRSRCTSGRARSAGRNCSDHRHERSARH